MMNNIFEDFEDFEDFVFFKRTGFLKVQKVHKKKGTGGRGQGHFEEEETETDFISDGFPKTNSCGVFALWGCKVCHGILVRGSPAFLCPLLYRSPVEINRDEVFVLYLKTRPWQSVPNSWW